MRDRDIQEQVVLIQISALLIAIKVNLHIENVRVATEIATQACAQFNIRAHDLASMETVMLQTLNWRVNAPTVHVFLNEYAPLMNNVNYILDIARFQIDLAILHPLIMVNYKPSIIAFAALMRADDVVYKAMMRPDLIPDDEVSDDDDDEDDDDDLHWELRGEYDRLMNELGLVKSVVLEAVFVKISHQFHHF